MKFPGFTADAAVDYTARRWYLSASAGNTSAGSTVAPAITDPCAHCGRFGNTCASARCYCICNGGIPIPSHWGRCGFLCT